MLNTWQFNIIAYLICVVLYYQLIKVALRTTKHDGAATILLQFIAGMSIFIISPLLPFKFPTDWKIYLLLIFACVFYAMNDRFQTTARKHLEVSDVSIILQLTNVFLIVIGLTIFKDQFVIAKITGAGLILIANFLLFYKRGGISINKYTWIAIAAAFGFAVAMSIDIGISREFNLPFYIIFTLLTPASIIFFGERIPVSQILSEWNSQSRIYFLLTGVFWGLTIFFSLRAFQLGKMTQIVPLEATSVLLNVLVAYFAFNEKDHLSKKLVAAILVMSGVYLTVF